MTKKRLNDLLILHTHQQCTDNLSLLTLLSKTIEKINFWSIYTVTMHNIDNIFFDFAY